MNNPHLHFENEINGIVIGTDEAGRGPLAGPVIAASILLPKNIETYDFAGDIKDSKQLSAKERLRLYQLLTKHFAYAVCEASVSEIDSLNILQASLLAMKRSVLILATQNHLNIACVLVDGNKAPELPYPTKTIIQGDSISLSIAAASIIAKVTRDRIMQTLSLVHPEYYWHKNQGYGTKQHIEALITHGPTPHHRLSFAPVKRIYQQLQPELRYAHATR